MKDTHTFNTESGRWMKNEPKVECSAELDLEITNELI